ncbi:hypothetical protein SAOR_08105 [Salinisphaera orenii MK-B5]|uniref:Uncharacterized protein n=1 Tax=Salinisphaera orenii MK-B5 TaxID=856730 RepID=A0A423PQH7_9GAMM|nr:hypothetical protein [Salinisphaera orenii]ROO27864.1 hypothetical protein SAOR_08105 [Salinisphaera orenii MK-B5]
MDDATIEPAPHADGYSGPVMPERRDLRFCRRAIVSATGTRPGRT